jgi:PAS domain S-box-containing protein
LEELVKEKTEKISIELEKHKRLENDIRQILEASSDAIRVIDTECNIIHCSKSFSRFKDHDKNPVGKKCYETSGEEECFTEGCPMRKIRESGKKFSFERKMKLKGGKEVFYHIDVIPYVDAVGNLLGIIENYRDISEEKKIKKKLEEEIKEHKRLEEEYRMLFDSSADAIMINGQEGFIDCNKATLKLFGLSSKEQFIKKHPSDFSPEKQPCGRTSAALSEEHDKRTLRDGRDFFEWVHLRPDGTFFSAEILLNRTIYRGEVVIQSTVRDITERKRTEERLEKEMQEHARLEKEYRMLFESSADAIMIHDGENYIDCNKAGLKLFGFTSKKQILEQHPRDLSAKKQPGGQNPHTLGEKHVKTALRTGSDFFEWVHLRLDGTPFLTEVLLSPILYRGRHVFQATVRDITERKEAEEKLKLEMAERGKLAEKYNVLLKASADAIGMFDENGFFECNRAFLEISGFSSKEEVMHKQPKDFSAPKQPDGKDSVTAAKEHIEKACREGMDFFEWICKRKDGSLYPCEIMLSRMEYQGGIALLIISRDITERKRAEEKLKFEMAEREKLAKKYDLLLQYSADGIGMFDESGFFECNRALFELYGYSSKEEFMHKQPEDISPPVQPNGVATAILAKEYIGKAVREGLNFFEWACIRKDGTPIMVEVMLSRMEYQGKVALLVIIRDITERKRAEEEIRHMNTIQKLILENSTLGIALIKNRVFEWVNGRVGELLQLSLDKLQGASTRIIYPSLEAYKHFNEKAYPMLAEGKRSDNVIELKRGDGSLFWGRLIGRALDPKDADGGSVWMLEDMTEEMQARKLAEENAQHKGRIEMANNVLHDIGNAMTGISTYVLKPQMEKEWPELQSLRRLHDLFMDNSRKLIAALGEDKQEALDKFIKALISSFEQKNSQYFEFSEKISGAVAHVCSVLELQRHYLKEKSTPLVTEINIANMINDTLVMMAGSLNKRNIKISFDVYGRKPNISGDQTRLIRVFLNIIKNICEAFDELESEKNRTLEVTVTKDEEKKEIKIVFADNAVGLTREMLRKVFDRGFTTKKDGSGIGLHECRSIVESHGGTMTMKSNGINTGASTIITFPCLKQRQNNDSTAE